jgi:phosphoglycolate phosphatase
MPQRFDLIVFDWDGTLMDSAACIAASLQAACRDLGLCVPGEREARYVIGLGLSEAIGHVLPDLSPDSYPGVVERYREHFRVHGRRASLFPGTALLLQDLHARGHLLAVATGKSRRGLDQALEETGLKTYFHGSRCADEGFSKPHPDMLERLMERFSIARERTLMIGDTTHDMLMARAAGVDAVAVAHGAHEPCELMKCEPLACLDDCIALHSWLALNG